MNIGRILMETERKMRLRIGEQVRKLISMKDGIGEWVLERTEIQDIDYLCTG